jgi:hypothetical protein
VIAFEPMTAPTDALVQAGPDLTLLAPGDSYRAAFTITVRESGGSPGSEYVRPDASAYGPDA